MASYKIGGLLHARKNMIRKKKDWCDIPVSQGGNFSYDTKRSSCP